MNLVSQVTRDICCDIVYNIGIERVLCDNVSVSVCLYYLSLIVEHFFKVRNMPLAVHRIPRESLKSGYNNS